MNVFNLLSCNDNYHYTVDDDNIIHIHKINNGKNYTIQFNKSSMILLNSKGHIIIITNEPYLLMSYLNRG